MTAASSPAQTTQTAPTGGSWAALLLLTTGFAMSQAFRTIAAIMAEPLQAELHLSPQQLGVFAAAYHFAFGALQLFMGIGIDMHGVRRTILAAAPLMVAGAVMSALASNFSWLVIGQILIGIGCAPAFLVCTVYIARHFPPARYTMVSSIILAVGGVGMLATGTPLAWLIEVSSWRMGFWVLAGCAALSWGAIALWMREPPPPAGAPRESLREAVRTFGALFRLPHTLGIMALALVTYASFVALRGLWLGPLMMQRHGWSLVATGNLAVVLTVVALVSLPLFGRLDPGPRRRRSWMLVGTVVSAALFALLALGVSAPMDVVAMLLVCAVSGYATLQYPDVKDAYEPAVIGRAMALFTMALFMGVALVQWLTGAIASIAQAHGIDPFGPVFGCIALLLALGALAFRELPQPARTQERA
ncbi:MAG: MFS transporter [Burkholderiales bacterium]|nr:MFS transporter [Burkholderiales bacterium]MBS0401969.1 MFS transporter [Pseudomonadota bacterium]MBS0413905.1 MFS transporter [Pseudomonadota bacterium]